MPSTSFTEGIVLREIPQSEEDLAFGRETLRKGCEEGIDMKKTEEEARLVAATGKMISPAFVVWQDKGASCKGRFVFSLKWQSKHWPKGSRRMETLPSYAMDLQKDEVLMSWDIKGGYHHFYLHPDMRDYFYFRYDGGLYCCLDLPFGWGRSVLWFTKLMRPLVQHLREMKWCRLLPYIDDFSAAPSPHGTISTEEDCAKAGRYLKPLFLRLGIVVHETKGFWLGTRVLELLGIVIDTELMRVFVSEKKITKVQSVAKKLPLLAQKNRRLVGLELLRHFCGVRVSLTLAVPLSRFYTRSLYFDMSLAESKDKDRAVAEAEVEMWEEEDLRAS